MSGLTQEIASADIGRVPATIDRNIRRDRTGYLVGAGPVGRDRCLISLIDASGLSAARWCLMGGFRRRCVVRGGVS
jgi:hypothetical protein